MRARMSTAEEETLRGTWPIVYGHRRRHAPDPGVRLAWSLFLGLGLPFALMAVLTSLARVGIYVELFRPLWVPWPPDLLKPFLGAAVFAASLAYLAYRIGHRTGFQRGAGLAKAAARNRVSGVPSLPPPPPDELESL